MRDIAGPATFDGADALFSGLLANIVAGFATPFTRTPSKQGKTGIKMAGPATPAGHSFVPLIHHGWSQIVNI
jgi:hypothetical protein